MRKNKFLLCFFIFIWVYLLSGCGKQNYKIAFLLYKSNDTFINEMAAYITANKPPHMTFEVRDAGNSQAVQNQQITELINSGFDALVINAVDRLACSSIVEKCEKENIPVIFFNREPLEDALTDSQAYYVGAAADSLGRKQADMLVGLFGDDYAATAYDKNGDGVIQLVILKGEQGHQDAEKRTDNCVNRLKELGYQTDVLAIGASDWKRQDAYDMISFFYSQYGDNIELVFANNDDMALGAIDYFTDAGVLSDGSSAYSQPIVIVGVDGTVVGLEAVRQGTLYGTVRNDFIKQSDAILTLVDYILNERDFTDFPYQRTNDHYIYIDGDIITQADLPE